MKMVCIGNIEPGMEQLLTPYRSMFLHLPSVPKVQLKEYYNRADVFILPSLGDSYALVVLEAIASGLPVIVTENVGAADAIENGKNGFVIPAGDTGSWLRQSLRYTHRNRFARQ